MHSHNKLKTTATCSAQSLWASRPVHKYKYANTPLHPHEPVATAQIDINAWPWMRLAVTEPPPPSPLIWKRSNWSTPYQPLILKRPSFHYHWSAVCLYVCMCVCLSVCVYGWERGRDQEGSVGMRHSEPNSNKKWTRLKVISINEHLNNSWAAQALESNVKLMQVNLFFSWLVTSILDTY